MDDISRELQDLDRHWSAAIVRNDVDAIGGFMSDDWVIVGSDGNVIDRARFLGVIRSGDLTHESMESDDWLVRVHGDAAIMTTRTRSTGKYQGQSFSTHERSTSVFFRRAGRWLCVHTHLTAIAESRSP